MGLRHFRLLVPLLAVLVPAAAAGAAGTATTAPATTAPATTTPITAPPGGGSTSPATTTTTAPAPPPGNVQLLDGGTVTVGVQSLPTEFNPSAPAGDNGITQMVMEQVWPQPFVVSNQLQPVAATPTATSPTFLVSAETVSVNPQTVVYTVDPHARWSDGVPITAADFVYDWHEQLAVGPELGGDAPLQGYRDIRSISSSDKGKVVTVVFAHPYADWYALFADLVPAHVAERYGFQKAFDAFDPHKVLSGGPFEITKVVPGQELVLSRNPHYWGQPAHLSHIVFRVEHGQAAMLAALDDHQVDVAEVMPGLDTTIAVQKAEDLLASNGLSPTLWQLTFNLTDPVTGLQLVREAVAKAINRTETAADSVDYLAENTSIPSNRLFGVAAPGSQGNDGAYAAVDVAQAQQLLAQAGYQPDADGLEIGTDGQPLVLQLVGPTGDPVLARAEEEVQAELLQAGIQLRIHNVAEDQLLSTVLPGGAYQVALAPYLESPYPSENTAPYLAPGLVTGGAGTASTVVGGAVAGTLALGEPTLPDSGAVVAGSVHSDVNAYQDPQVNDLVSQAESDLNATAMYGLYNQIDTRLWVDLPTLPLFQEPETLVVRDDVVNVTNTATWAGPTWDAQDWAIQTSPTPTVPTTSP